jgi:hypothetical protein
MCEKLSWRRSLRTEVGSESGCLRSSESARVTDSDESFSTDSDEK